MDQQEGMDSNRAPTLNKGEDVVWRKRMSAYLQSLGCGVWNAVTSDYIPPKILRASSQKKSKKNNSKEMESILDGLPQPIKEKTGQCISAKEIWVKLKKINLVKVIVVSIHTVSKDEDEEPSKYEVSKDKSDGEVDL